jgi:hypothetical protein
MTMTVDLEFQKHTFPDLWSGTTKLRIDLSPGVPNSSTVIVVKSWKIRNPSEIYSHQERLYPHR